MPEWTHFDENGNARMVDVTEKNSTIRTATAVGSLLVSEDKENTVRTIYDCGVSRTFKCR